MVDPRFDDWLDAARGSDRRGRRSRPGRDRGRRRRRDEHRVPPREARMDGRAAGRSGGADERLHVPLGGARGPAPELREPHADDDVRRGALPDARRRHGRRPRMAPGRHAAPRVVAVPDGGPGPPGRVGEVFGLPVEIVGGGGPRTLPADRRLARARRPVRADRRPHRPHRADAVVRGRREGRRACAPASGSRRSRSATGASRGS